ncbi:AfsR/SARP family transcriptional regulator [Saccharothrix xinjiangensis]|uniref:BTAD domain-containing putative transcriptional regulator n=1 Tax=Saccharothrix xinjiangensis TaxID=204798 RepID=A0ABV9XUY7_9PSEU
MAVEFCVLGPVEARIAGWPVDLGRARQRWVLAVLLVEANRWLSADQLLDRAWGDRVPASGRDTLYGYLSRLRRVLRATDEADIVRRSGGYELVVDEDAVDLHRFRRLVVEARAADDERAAELFAEATGLWRGEVCAGLDTPWAQAVRTELDRQRLAAELDHADLRLRTGRHTDLLVDLTSLAAAHPLDERVSGQFMLALYRSGRQVDALEHYRRLRTRLTGELGVDPGPDLRQLHQRILAADPALATPVPATGRLPAAVRQLPAAPRTFTGRAPELAELDRALTTGVPATGITADTCGPSGGTPGTAPVDGTTVVISAIGGAGGIGKTWLALTWAHRHVDRFPDGQLFVDLRGFSPDAAPLDPVVALRRFLDALGVEPARCPPDPDALAALYRSLVAGRRMLIVLDNAATAEQVVPLLPGSASCTVLVTSRHRLPALLARHGARPLPLGTLDDAESRALLAAALGADRVADDERATAELIALCGGFPLALALVAARLHLRLPLADAVAELRELRLHALDDADHPAASLPTVLSWSLRHLTDSQQRVFALLGVAPGPDIGLPAAADLTGLPPHRTHAALRALADASLIDPRPGGRHTMHDLVRAYATTLADDLPDAVRLPALRRVIDFYLHTAHTADRLLDAHRPQIRLAPAAPGVRPHPLGHYQEALTWLKTEYRHLLDAQQAAVAHGWHRVVWQLAWTLHTFHFRQGHHHDELSMWRTALDAAEHLRDPAALARVHRRLGLTHARLRRYDQARHHLDQALAVAERHHDTVEQACIHYTFAWAAIRRTTEPEAREHGLLHARRAWDLYRTLDLPVWEANALTMHGWFLAHTGDHDTAREHCRAGLALQRHHHCSAGEAECLRLLGWIDHLSGHHHRAVRHYREALALMHTLGHTYAAAITLDDLGNSHAALGHHDQARTTWLEAVESYTQQGDHDAARRVRQRLDDLKTPDGGPPPQSAEPTQ